MFFTYYEEVNHCKKYGFSQDYNAYVLYLLTRFYIRLTKLHKSYKHNASKSTIIAIVGKFVLKIEQKNRIVLRNAQITHIQPFFIYMSMKNYFMETLPKKRNVHSPYIQIASFSSLNTWKKSFIRNVVERSFLLLHHLPPIITIAQHLLTNVKLSVHVIILRFL